MTDEEAVVAAANNFYQGIEDMVGGKGTDRLRAAWHHGPHVTSGHPSGDWAEGWDEVWATWEVFASFGRADRGGSKITSMKAHVFGDVAYTTCVFQASPAFGGESLNCTNVLHRIDGAWKIIHHHVDKSPAMGAALEKILEEGA